MPSDKIDLDAIRARHEDHMVLWAGPVDAMQDVLRPLVLDLLSDWC